MDNNNHTNRSDASHITSTARTISNNSPKKPKKLKILAGIVLLAGVVALSIYVYLAYFYNLPPKGIYADLNGQQITQSDFNQIYNAYLNFSKSNSKDSKSINAKQIEKTAADEVLLRLALQAEAQTHNVDKCTSEIVDQRLATKYASNGGKEQYYGLLESTYGWTPVVSAHKECLAYYQEKLTNKLVDGVDLFGVYIRWDIAKGQSADIRNKLDTYAKQRLETEYLPLFENGTSQEDIIAKTDINPSLPSSEFTGKVLDFKHSASRYTSVSQMNSLTYSKFQQYQEGESELPYVENLKVGQSTKPFKSKTGYWIIYRATGRNQSAYKSLDELRSAYVKKGKVSKSYFSLPSAQPDTSQPEYLGSPGKKSSLINNLKTLLVPTANATDGSYHAGVGDSPCFGSNLHGVSMNLKYYDKDTGQQIPGGIGNAYYPGPDIISATNEVNFGDTNIYLTDWCNDEPEPGLHYGVVEIGYDDGYLLYNVSTMPAGNWSFLLSCFFEWDYKFNPPYGYETISDEDYDDSKDVKDAYGNIVNRGRFQVLLPTQINFTGLQSDLESPPGQYRIPTVDWQGISNGAAEYSINVYFTKKKPAIEITKAPSASPAVNTAPTTVTSQTASISAWNNNNPNTISDLWFPEDSNYYSAHVQVPVGWAVKNATVDGAVKDVTCVTYGAYICSVRTDVSPGNTSRVVFNFIESKGDINCKKLDGKYYWHGWGVDASQQASPPVVKLYRSGTLLQTITADRELPDKARQIYLRAAGYTGVLDATKYDFHKELNPSWHNGDTSPVTVNLVVNNPAGEKFLKTISGIGDPSDTTGCGTFAYAWPWLQTSGGDVIASGKITGQITSPNTLYYPGARLTATTDKEAEFLIISALGNGSPFCSTYNYILTNTTATVANSCGNGAGYTLNSYPLNSGGKDVIVEGVKKAYDTLRASPSACSGEKTTTDLATITVPEVACLDGAVYKLTGGSPLTLTLSTAINVTQGRVTIYVDGPLYINANINYSPAGITNIKDYPNLAIVVKGNVNIASSVTNISALIYASGKIDTCATAPTTTIPSVPLLTQNCSTSRLEVDGSLTAKNGIRFGRSYYDANRNPAENIALTPQTFVYPAPGIDIQSALSQQKGAYTLDPGEYNPRF